MQKTYDIQAMIDAVGGKENIAGIAHCATRLRFTLVDESLAKDEDIKKLTGVLSLVKQGGQYQLVIGRNVRDVYESVQSYLGGAPAAEVPVKPAKKKHSIKNLWNAIFGAIIGSLTPLIPPLVGVGLGKCLLLLMSQFGFSAETSQTYAFFTFVFDTGFTFLPVFIAFSAGKYFKMNPYLAAFFGCMLLHPSWTAMVNAAESVLGSIKLFGAVPVVAMSYSSTVIPAIMIVYVASKVYGFLDKHIPKAVRSLVVPLVTILIMAPLSFVILAPLMTVISLVISKIVTLLYGNFGMLAIGACCLIYPWLVSTGMHAALALAGIEMLGAQGFDPFTRTLTLCHNMSQAAASFAVSLRSKNKELKSTAFSAGLTALLSGITEPSLYGVTLKLKKPMYACMIGGSVAGLYAGFVGLKAYAFLTPGLLALPMWMAEGSGSNFIHALITIAICMIVTFIATLVIGFEDPKEIPAEEAIAQK